ncbi:hypothetical protein ULMS_21410 [Patiriisocius marinistellae]|uniref:Deoxyribose-phosphate aldolase n=1 Tax=Patiriisocius marinistellae TaxID=2494560 RepID=A0A5J4FX61_9FLAO|nr:DUF6503 family protein [Patiriisocius marinistellae]GEQ86633.1 hypothetical protein ULMS_21410 [Patiriisocius marinistellae]
MKYILSIILFTTLVSCANTEEKLTAQQIIDNAIETACSGNCENITIDFDFRKGKYQSTRDGGNYSYSRIIHDSVSVIKDVFSNTNFRREINDSIVNVSDSIKIKIVDGVNSVHYFSQLPYGLNAPAVNKKLVGEGSINDVPYYKIEVTFKEEGGGTDFDDVFMYWVHKTNFTVDYLAYSYAVNGGGIRFREAYNPRTIEGVRFVDYNNYKPESLETPLTDLDKLFEQNNLKLLSKIETENVRVMLN